MCLEHPVQAGHKVGGAVNVNGEEWVSHREGGDSGMGRVRRSFVLGVRKRQGRGRSGGVTEWEETVVWGE